MREAQDKLRKLIGDRKEGRIVGRPDRVLLAEYEKDVEGRYVKDAEGKKKLVGGLRWLHETQYDLDELRSKQPQRVLLFLALGVGNHDHRFQAERIAHHRYSDSGVAGRAFDDRTTRFEATAAHRVLDDEKRRAIFHRLTRIHELGFAENLAACSLRRPLQSNQRRVADRRQDVMFDL